MGTTQIGLETCVLKRAQNLALTVLFVPTSFDSGRNIDALLNSVCDFEESKSRESTSMIVKAFVLKMAQDKDII